MKSKALPRRKALDKNSRLLKKALDNVKTCLKSRNNCKFQCLLNFAKEDITQLREGYWTKTFENRVEWFYDKLFEALRRENILFFSV